MKNIYLLLLFTFLTYRSFSQLTISPVSLSTYINIYEEKVCTIYLNNSSSEAKLYWWKVIKPNGFPTKWKTQTCDGVLCYNWNFDKNSTNKPDTVFPNIPRLVTIHFKPDTMIGEANICFKIYSDNQYQNEVASTDCNDLLVAGTTSANEIVKNEMLIYPNPTSHYFSIKNDEEITSVKVYDMMGRLVLNEEHKKEKKYNVFNFTNGLNVIELTYSNNNKSIEKLIVNRN